MSTTSSCELASTQQAELEELRQRLLLMAGRVEGMLADAVRAVRERDIELAQATIAADRRVNRAEMETDALCLKILQRCCSMAPKELRFVTLALKMVTDLERIGDLAANICRSVPELARASRDYYREVERMGELAGSMVHQAIEAFVAGNVSAAREVLARDEEVDALVDEFGRHLARAIVADSELVPFGLAMLSVAKWLERAADHATNLAEQAILLVEGKDLRHRGRLETAV